MSQQHERRTPAGPSRHGDSVGQKEQSRGISPLNPSSMPRAEDDEQTYANSPEYHDRVPDDPSKPEQAGAPEGYAPEGTTKPPDTSS